MCVCVCVCVREREREKERERERRVGEIFMPSLFSGVLLFATPWTVARQAPLSMGFSRQEYWSE